MAGDPPPPHARAEADIELEPVSNDAPAGASPPLPGGEVQDPSGRLEFRGQTSRLLLQELVRASLALSFVALLALVIILAFKHIGSKAWPNVRESLEILVPTLAGLIGSATGFYFGTRR
jgi:hypothetical protein